MAISQNQFTDHTVTCVRCKKGFEGFAPEQAPGCAADVHDTMIVGHYGSAIADLTQFHFSAGEKPDDLNEGQICDTCIADLIDDGTLLKEGKSNVGSIDFALPANLIELVEEGVFATRIEDDGDDEDEGLVDEP